MGGACSTSGGATCTTLVCKPEEERPLGRHVNKITILEEILQEYGERIWTGFSWLWIGTGVGVL